MKNRIFTILMVLCFVGLTNAQTLVDFSNAADYDVSSSWGYGTAPEVSGDTLFVDKDVDGTFDAAVQVALATPVTVSEDHSILAIKARIKGATATGMRIYAKVSYNDGTGGEGWTNNVTEVDGQFIYITWDGVLEKAVDTLTLHLGGWDNGNAPADLQGEVAIDEISVWNKLEAPVADFENAADYMLKHWSFGTDPVVTGGSLVVEKNADGTFDQQVEVGLANLVPVVGGSTRMVINVKSSVTGARLYARAHYTDGTQIESWTTNIVETADADNGLILEGLTIGKTIDSVKINIGGWDNGNAPADLQGTYEVTSIYLTEPPVEYVEPRVTVDISFTEQDIDVTDGPSESDWMAATAHDIVNRDSADSPDDLSFVGTFRGLWNNDYLFLFFEVEDADAFTYNGTDGWKKDGVQLYLDVRNQLLEGRRENSRQHQLTVNYGNSPVAEGGTGLEGWEGATVDSIYANADKPFETLFGSLPKSGGYYLEMAIPWGSMYFDGTSDDHNSYDKAYAAIDVKEGSVVAFDVQANDGDDDGRYNVVTWSSHSADDPGSYQNSGVWGGFKLKGGSNATSKINTASASIYPNPASSDLFIDMQGMSSVSVYDITGRMVITKSLSGNNTSLNISNLSAGIYLVKVDGAQGTATQRLQVK